MRIFIFSVLFMALLAGMSLATELQITQIHFNVDYNKPYIYTLETDNLKNFGDATLVNGSRINADILPGSNVTFYVTVENPFQGGSDLRNVIVRMTAQGIDDGSDMNEHSASFDLDAGTDYRAVVKFMIPFIVEQGSYNVNVEAEGENSNKTLFNTQLNLKLNVKKQSHDIRISKLTLDPITVDCNRKSTLTAEVVNVGSNLEDEIALEFKSASLGINSYDSGITLKSAKDAEKEEKIHDKSLSIELPKFFKSGTYQIFVNLYWRNFVNFDQKIVDLTVKDCIPSSSPIQQKPGQVHPIKNETSSPLVQQPQFPGNELITTSQETSVFDSPTLLFIYTAGFVILFLAVLLVIGLVMKIALKKI